MAKHIPGAFRRVLALATSVLLIAAQLVLPVAALAQDISMLPTVTLQWTAPADGSVQSTTVMASLYGEQVVYWATVPEEALQTGVTIAAITGGGGPLGGDLCARRRHARERQFHGGGRHSGRQYRGMAQRRI